MKRKIFSKLLIGALLVASVSSFVSCKDYDDDIKDLQTQINSLSGAVDQKTATINQTITSMQQNLDQLNKLEATLTDKMNAGDVATLAAAKQAIADAQATLQAAIDKNAAAIAQNAEAIKQNANGIAANKADIAAIVKVNSDQDEAIIKAQAAADQALAQIAELQASLADYAKKAELEAAKKDIEANAAEIAKIKQSIATINEKLAEIETIKANLSKVTSDLAETNKRLGTLSTTLEKAVADLAELTTAVNGQAKALEALKARVDAVDLTQIDADVKTLKAKVAPMEEQLEKLKGLETATVNAKFEAIDGTIAELKAAHETFATKGEVANLDSEIKALKETTIPAVEAKINAVDAKYNTIAAALAKALRSLVYMPYLYVDGIESIEYPWLYNEKLAKDPVVPTMNRQRTTGIFAETYVKTIKELASDVKKKFPKLAELNDWVPDTKATDFVEYYGPVWPVEYHMNPSRATTAWSDIKGWNRRDAEIITRSDAASTIKVAEKYVDGTPLFSNKDGVLTVGLQVEKPGLLANRWIPSEGDGRPGKLREDWKETTNYQFDDMIALQAKAGNDTIITSDYAMIYPEEVELEGIVWTKRDSKLYTNKLDFDEEGKWCEKVVHVWDMPKEALACAGDNAVYPDIELYYNNTKGIVLKELLGVHYWRYGNTLNCGGPQLLKFTDAAFGYYGLSCEFQLVGYAVDGNVTIDSNYAEFTDADENGVSKTGTIRARNVKEDGSTIDTESATSVDREPLVRVFVKRGSRVLLDGYILIHITKEAPADADPLIVDNYPAQDFEFNLCDDGNVFVTNWSQFSYYVLTQKLDNMTKEQFDASYGKQFAGVPDLYNTGKNPITGAATPVTLADNSQRYDDVVIYKKTAKGFEACKATDIPGYVRYYHNAQGTTNHRFEWTLTNDELEKLTHDAEAGKLPKEYTMYFRYTGQAAAQYPYIYVKMTVNLTRKAIAESGIKEKNTNYWFKYTGNDNGWDAVVWNPWYPRDGENTKNYSQNLISTFVAVNGKNVVNFLNTTGLAKGAKANINASINETASLTSLAKFYFTPYEFTIKAQDGTEYVITPRSGKNDERWNAFVCKYVWFANDGTLNVYRWDATQHNLHWYAANNDKTYTEHKWGTAEANAELHKVCAIDYNDGVYTNNRLYAVKKGAYGSAANYTEIATLNQNIDNGTMRLTWREPDDDITKEVLNAVGYEDDVHSNILKELNCMVGVIAHNGCDVAVIIPEYAKDEENLNAGTFYVSWQRPINVVNDANPMVDAKNNADYVWLVDFMKIYDWRGPEKGQMWGANQWLWAYYNIKGLTIDVTPSKMKTNMHQADVNTFVPMSSVTTRAKFSIVKTNRDVTAEPYTVVLDLSGYNAAAKNDALLKDMGLKPVDVDKKIAFGGGLKYENNGDNVKEFDVIVPVTVTYDWGRFIAPVKVHIDRTLGN